MIQSSLTLATPVVVMGNRSPALSAMSDASVVSNDSGYGTEIITKGSPRSVSRLSLLFNRKVVAGRNVLQKSPQDGTPEQAKNATISSPVQQYVLMSLY